MLTPEEIQAGSLRLSAGKLKANDRTILLAAFGLYLKAKAGVGEFADLATRLAAAADVPAGDKNASMLAAVLISLEENGFSLAELRGGKGGIESNEAGETAFKIRFALTLLGYALPEDFSGGVEASGGRAANGDYGSASVPIQFNW